MTLEHRQKHIRVFIYAGIVAATLAAYEPIRHNDFTHYDDNNYIYDNPQVTSGITLQSLGEAFTKPHYYMWHPLTTISHILDWQLFGANPLGHHIVNLLLHIVNALLLFWILTNLTSSIWASGFVAAVFALHPLQVESVAWAAERKTVLSGLFWFVSIAVYIWFTKRPSIRRYVFLFVVYGLCIMTKPIVVTLPFVLLLLDYWPLERVKKVSAGKLITEKIPLLALSITLSVITLIAQRSGGVVQTLERAPLDYRVANMFLSYIRYIGKMIWPSRLALFYTHPRLNISDALAVTCAVLFILLTVLCIEIGRRKRYATFGWLWYAGTLVPVIGLVQSGTQAMANRYMYIPMVGLLIVIAWGVRDFIVKRPGIRTAAAVMCVIALSSILILTRIQVGHWRNDRTLFEYTLKVTEDNILAENNYGLALLEAGSIDEAIEHFTNARRINKYYVSAYINLGMAYSRQGKYEPAIQNWTKALELKPNSLEALNNLAWVMATVNEATIEDANKAIELVKRVCEQTGYKNPSMMDTLAAAYAAAGRFEEAVKTAGQAVEEAKRSGKEDLANEIQDRIKLYQSGERYRQKQNDDGI